MKPPTAPATVHKVTAFVTRGHGPDRELLVFRHPSAGVQLPAGTVEVGEAIEAAVVREAREETGLACLAIVTRLATLLEPLEPDERVIATPARLLTEPAADAPWVSVCLGGGLVVSQLGRGLKVRQLKDERGYLTRAGYARVGYDRYDVRGPRDWVLFETIAGWVPEAAITADVKRHLFHLPATAPTPTNWTHDGDVPGCELRWVSLAQDPALIRGQDLHLARVLDQLKYA